TPLYNGKHKGSHNGRQSTNRQDRCLDDRKGNVSVFHNSYIRIHRSYEVTNKIPPVIFSSTIFIFFSPRSTPSLRCPSSKLYSAKSLLTSIFLPGSIYLYKV